MWWFKHELQFVDRGSWRWVDEVSQRIHHEFILLATCIWCLSNLHRKMNLSQCHFTEVHFMPPYPLRCSPSAVTPRERRLDAALQFVPSWTHSIVPDLKVLTYYRKSGWYHIPHQPLVSRTWILWKNMQSTQSNGAFDWVQKHHNFRNSRKFLKIPEIRSSNQCSWRILCPSQPPTFQPSFDAAGLPKLTVCDEFTWTASRGALEGTSISHPRKGKLIFPTTYEEDSSIVPKEDMWKLYVPSTHIIYANL